MVTATVTDSNGLYNGAAQVLAYEYEDGNLVNDAYLTEGSGYGNPSFSGMFPVASIPTGDLRLHGHA